MENRDFQKEIEIDMVLSPSFIDILNKFIGIYHTTAERLAENIGVSVETISRYRTGETRPDIRMAVALCLAFSLNFRQSEKMLNSLGFTLKGSSREQCAYRRLIKNYSGLSIKEANELLSKCGLLESQKLYPRKRK